MHLAAMNPAHPTRQPRSGRFWTTAVTATLAALGVLGAGLEVDIVLAPGGPALHMLLGNIAEGGDPGRTVVEAVYVLELLAATSRARETLDLPLISMSMGGIGSISRIMGWIYGSAATFAVGKSSSAPGQIAIEELRTTLAIVRQAVLGK